MTAVETIPAALAARGSMLPLPLRLAARQMRAGFDGFVIFILCIALGVMVIAAVGVLGNSLEKGLESQGRQIIGGDIAIQRMHQRAVPAERAALSRIATVSETASMRSMARSPTGDDQTLIELRSADASYPLVGSVDLKDDASLTDVLSGRGAAVDPILLERLRLSIGDEMRIGAASVIVRAVIDDLPDGLADRLTYGPRVLVSQDTLQETGLVVPGALVRWRYALRLPAGQEADNDALLAARAALKADLSEAGFTIVDRRDPSPDVRRTLERLRQFLTLLGLTALIVGGVGIANAVNQFVDRRRRTIATMKSVGATGRQIFAVFLAQILVISGIGVLIGLAAGSSLPLALNAWFGDRLPLAIEVSVSLWSLLTAAGYGLLVALLFSLWPLGRAGQVSPAVLFRDEVGAKSGWPPAKVIMATALVAAGLAAVTILAADVRKVAIYFLGCLVLVFATFYALGHAASWLARRLPRPRRPELALALGNIGAPGGLSRAVILSLGSGLSLLVATALTDASLVEELNAKLPQSAPDYYVLDIRRDDMPALAALIAREAPGTTVQEAPMLRGRLVRLGDRSVEDMKPPAEAEWVLRGDRGITFSGAVPEGSRVVAGEWWSEDYDGEPLVSFEAQLARLLGLGVGDEVTVNVLGRNITARIASLRELDWDSLAINFVMVFSPNTLRGAPYNLLATVKLPEGTGLAGEAAMSRAIAQAYPTVTAIRVRDAIEAFSGIFEKVMTAVRVAGSVTLLAGALVLAGALATAQRRRVLDAVILKTVGATRRQILSAHMIEYLLLAIVTSGFAVALGALASWVALSQVLEAAFVFSVPAVLQTLAVALGLVVGFGSFGTWQVLRARPVPILRGRSG